MDDHRVIVIVEYHVMAEGSPEAITRVMDSLEHRDQSLTPYTVQKVTVEI